MLKIIKNLIGILIILAGVALGTYLGLWVMLVGGIVQIVKSAQGNVDALGIAFGIIRILLASVVGWIVFFIISCIGTLFLGSNR